MVMVANKIQRYIEDHFDEKITYEQLKEFIFIQISIIIYEENIWNSPNNLLTKYRLEEGTKYLLLTPIDQYDCYKVIKMCITSPWLSRKAMACHLLNIVRNTLV